MKKCKKCGSEIADDDEYWYNRFGMYYICSECLNNSSKVELLDFVIGD